MDGKQVVKVPYTSSVKVKSNTVFRQKTNKEFLLTKKMLVASSPATYALEWGENLVKSAPVLAT